jgi:hypothetical protein
VVSRITPASRDGAPSAGEARDTAPVGRQLDQVRSLVAREGQIEIRQALIDVLETLSNVAVSAVTSDREGP